MWPGRPSTESSRACVRRVTSSGVLSNDAGSRVIGGEEDLGATAPTASAILGFWRGVLGLIVAGYAMSMVACMGTMIYLAMRRVCDGQDTTEIWDPAA